MITMEKPWSRKKKLLWQLGTLVGAPVGIALIAGLAIPGIIFGFPVFVGKKVYQRMRDKPNKHSRRVAVVGSVVGSFLISPVLASMAVGVGVPVLLAYVYGVVPLSLCRSSGCVQASGSGPKLDENDDLYTLSSIHDQEKASLLRDDGQSAAVSNVTAISIHSGSSVGVTQHARLHVQMEVREEPPDHPRLEIELHNSYQYRASIVLFDNPFKFGIHLEKNKDDYARIKKECARIGNEDTVPLAVDISKGQLVVAKWSTDQMWYRAMVRDADKDTARVWFIDFGNQSVEKLQNIRHLPVTAVFLRNVHKQVVCCTLHGVELTDDFTCDVRREMYKEYFFERHALRRFSYGKWNTYVAVLSYVDNVADVTVVNSKATSLALVFEEDRLVRTTCTTYDRFAWTERFGFGFGFGSAEYSATLPTFATGQQVSMMMTFIVNRNELWGRPNGVGWPVPKPVKRHGDVITIPVEGMVCVAPFQEYFYRAKVVTVHASNVIDVLFVDFGNQETVETVFRIMPGDCNEHPACLRLKIDGFIEGHTYVDVAERYTEALTVCFEVVDVNSNDLLVKLTEEERRRIFSCMWQDGSCVSGLWLRLSRIRAFDFIFEQLCAVIDRCRC